jgi:hypothetical protein
VTSAQRPIGLFALAGAHPPGAELPLGFKRRARLAEVVRPSGDLGADSAIEALR